MKVKNKYGKRGLGKSKSLTKISSNKVQEVEEGSKGLPETITLEDGRIFTNQDIVSIKRLLTFGYDDEKEETWKEIEKVLREIERDRTDIGIRKDTQNKDDRVHKVIRRQR